VVCVAVAAPGQPGDDARTKLLAKAVAGALGRSFRPEAGAVLARAPVRAIQPQDAGGSPVAHPPFGRRATVDRILTHRTRRRAKVMTPCSKPGSPSPGRRQALRTIGVAAAAQLFAPRLVRAQRMPDVTRLVIAFPAGNPVEAPGRALAQALRLTTGRNHIVDNKPGAGGLIGANEVARSRPDGSTLLWVNATHRISPIIYKKLPFDALNDFTPITKILTTSGFALLVRRDSPYRTVEQLIKAAQERPDTISYASLGIGNTIHLIGELFGNAVGAKFLHVPYRASPIPDLLGGRVEFTFAGIDISKRMVDSGDVRVLAVTSPHRIPEAPDAPTYAELGLQGIDVPGWGGVLGPRGMSPQLVESIQNDMALAVRHQSFLDYVRSSGDMQVVADSPSEFTEFLRSEIERLRRMLAPLGLALESGF